MSDASTAWPLREPAVVLPTVPTSCTFPFMGFLASVASACSVLGGHGRSSHHSPPLALPSSKTGTRMWGEWACPSEPHPTSLYLAATVFLLLYSVLKATLQYGTGSVWLLGPMTPLGGNEAETQKMGGVPRLWEEHPGRQALCSPQRRCVSPAGRAFTWCSCHSLAGP